VKDKLTVNNLTEYLVKTNERRYNILKAIEEAQELALILTQSLSKGVPEEKITEEIGDLKFRLGVIESYYSKRAVRQRILYKKSKCVKYIGQGRYKNNV